LRGKIKTNKSALPEKHTFFDVQNFSLFKAYIWFFFVGLSATKKKLKHSLRTLRLCGKIICK